MATNNVNFSRLPANVEHGSSYESPFVRPEAAELPNQTGELELTGDIELDTAISVETLSVDLNTEAGRKAQLRAEIATLNTEVARAKSEAGLTQIDSVANIDATVHIQEKSRLQKILGLLIKNEPPFSEHGLVNQRKNQLQGIIGALAGDHNKLRELNGNSAVF